MLSNRISKNPELAAKIAQLALPLAPLVQLTSGNTHPAFPSTLLNYWLLVDSELEDLAHFYHQRTPCVWTHQYPKPISWQSGLTLNEKRRKFGKFIGLRGCETPFVVKTEEQILEEARIASDRENEVRRKMEWY